MVVVVLLLFLEHLLLLGYLSPLEALPARVAKPAVDEQKRQAKGVS